MYEDRDHCHIVYDALNKGQPFAHVCTSRVHNRQAREAERALLLFEEMKEKNLHLSVHTYGAVINACALRYDKHLEVFRLLAEMQGAGIACDQRMVGMLLHRY